MTLLALDQSSITTGWSIFKDNNLIKYGHFTLKKDDDIGVRLVQFRRKIEELINEYTPDEVIFEDIQLQSNVTNNVKTFKVLAQVQGVLLALLTELQIPYTIVLASSWKSTLGIKGQSRAEQKRNAQKYVVDKYGIKPTQDESDAVCIGEHRLQTQGSAWD